MKDTPKRLSIVVDAKIPFIKGVLEPYADVIYAEGSAITPHVIANADALIIRTRTHCNEALLQGSSVKFIATATIGTDHIDTGYCDANNITWTNAAGCNSGSVYQYIASALAWLLHNKKIGLTAATLGVVGCGHVGSKVVHLAKTLGLNVLVNDPPQKRDGKSDLADLDYLLRNSDIISIHTPLTRAGQDKTEHLLNTQTLKLLKPTAWLINSSRGEVVDGTALSSTLTNHSLAGAILDVWEQEPAISASLLQQSTLGTPHIAGYSADGKAMATQMSVRSLSRHFGLNLNQWSPQSIPLPENSTTIRIDARDKTLSDIFCEAVFHTYNIANDDQRLRGDISGFEKQRGDYPVRREFQAYHLIIQNGDKYISGVLSSLGFQVTLS